MTATVLIKRSVLEGKEELLENLYKELVALAVDQPGFLGAQTMKRVDKRGQYLILSKWETVEHWSIWLESETRRSYQERIDALTEADTKFEVYEG